MGPLGFVNWRIVNAQFCLLMWVAAAVLALVILMHVAPTPSSAVHQAITHGALYRAGAS
jgi:hypothetical protein